MATQGSREAASGHLRRPSISSAFARGDHLTARAAADAQQTRVDDWSAGLTPTGIRPIASAAQPSAVEAGAYVLHVSAADHLPQQQVIVVAPDEVTRLEVTLVEGSLPDTRSGSDISAMRLPMRCR